MSVCSHHVRAENVEDLNGRFAAAREGLPLYPAIPASLLPLIGNNTAPTPSQCSDATRLIHELEVYLAAINTRIDTHQDKYPVIELIQEVGGIEAGIEKLRSVLAGYRRIPMEIVCEIFKHAALDLHGPLVRDHADLAEMRWLETGVRAPWRLGHICASWRNAAVGLQSIWGAVRVSSTRVERCIPRGDALLTQLHRAGNHPLRVELVVRGSLIDHDVLDVVRTLVGRADRWGSFSLLYTEALTPGMMATFMASFAPMRGRLSTLASLTVSGPMSLPGGHLLEVCSLAPALRHIQLAPAEHEDARQLLLLPWSQFTRATLDLTAPSRPTALPAVRQLLLHAINLRSLEISTTIEAVPLDDVVSPVAAILPRLKSLSISDARLLALFTTPALTSLSIGSFSNFSGTHHTVATAFIERSGCAPHLISLKLKAVPAYFLAVDIFSALPALRTLRVSMSATRSDFLGAFLLAHGLHAFDHTLLTIDLAEMFRRLTLSPAGGNCCPHLSSFKLTESTSWTARRVSDEKMDEEQEAYSNMVASRSNGLEVELGPGLDHLTEAPLALPVYLKRLEGLRPMLLSRGLGLDTD
uniref:F-box domain-containing protein n=1 Tax=Mycena chlorophos TaxID=658473 RepID=A0ABQ0LHA7_MYCCL|nr:predicted protein [Mycena chlorophos]